LKIRWGPQKISEFEILTNTTKIKKSAQKKDKTKTELAK